jgi:hypothetical protein
VKIKPIIVYAAYHSRPGAGLNPYWIRPLAKDVRSGGDPSWKKLHKDGWRVVKVKVSAIGKPI